MEKLIEGERVGVSNISQDEADAVAINSKQRIYIASTQDGRYVCVMQSSEKSYKMGESFNACAYKFVSRIPVYKEVTMAEVEQKFGCKVKIIK